MRAAPGCGSAWISELASRQVASSVGGIGSSGVNARSNADAPQTVTSDATSEKRIARGVLAAA
jgi:hypothetical protein